MLKMYAKQSNTLLMKYMLMKITFNRFRINPNCSVGENVKSETVNWISPADYQISVSQIIDES